MATLIIAEKQKEAHKIATALGIASKTQTHFECSNGTLVAYAQGHLLELSPPDHYKPEWKAWNDASLPMIPTAMTRTPVESKLKILRPLVALVKKATHIVIATDSEREGELIGREILDHAKYRGTIQRYWSSASSPAAVKTALQNLQPSASTIGLYHAAVGRQEADWLIGMNLTRLMTVAKGVAKTVISVGRVQTPTLALIVKRDREIANFQVRPYFEVHADVRVNPSTLIRMKAITPKRIDAETDAMVLQATLADSRPFTITVKAELKTVPPPPIFNLVLLQAFMNRTEGWSLKKTMDMGQTLKDAGCITYHRTDSTHLEETQKADVPHVLAVIANFAPLQSLAQLVSKAPILRSTVFDSAKVDAHPGITPTDVPVGAHLSADEITLYTVIATRYLAALAPDYQYQQSKITGEANGIQLATIGRQPVRAGWTRIERKKHDDGKPDDTSAELIPFVADGAVGQVEDTVLSSLKTKPPKYYTEATIAEAMIAIAQTVEDPSARARLRETSGLGRPSTYGEIIETLLRRTFIERQQKSLVAKPLGFELVDSVVPELTDPVLTAEIEDFLEDVAKNKRTLGAFRTHIHAVTTQFITAQRLRSFGSTGIQTITPIRPTDQEIGKAKERAEEFGLDIPYEVCGDRSTLQAWLKNQIGDRPSTKQIAFATSISKRLAIELPKDISTSAATCSAFINKNGKKR